MSDVKFELKPVKKKPSRIYRKGSKYDLILDTFLEGKDSLVEVSSEGKDANYLRTQLNKRIEARELKGVQISRALQAPWLGSRSWRYTRAGRQPGLLE